MINNLFDSFDPASSVISAPINWSASVLILIFIPILFWAIPSRWIQVWLSLSSFINKEFSNLLAGKMSGGPIVTLRLFLFIFFRNLMGLLPHVFTRTRHIAITITLSIPLWASFIIYRLLNQTQKTLAYLVPLGTPAPLSPLIVIIEFIRNLIRPATLAIRLAANIIAGHLLIILMSRVGPTIHNYLTPMLIIGQIPLLILELAVAIIQAFVFRALVTMYAAERMEGQKSRLFPKPQTPLTKFLEGHKSAILLANPPLEPSSESKRLTSSRTSKSYICS